jgi:hypothetical protein
VALRNLHIYDKRFETFRLHLLERLVRPACGARRILSHSRRGERISQRSDPGADRHRSARRL